MGRHSSPSDLQHCAVKADYVLIAALPQATPALPFSTPPEWDRHFHDAKRRKLAPAHFDSASAPPDPESRDSGSAALNVSCAEDVKTAEGPEVFLGGALQVGPSYDPVADGCCTTPTTTTALVSPGAVVHATPGSLHGFLYGMCLCCFGAPYY